MSKPLNPKQQRFVEEYLVDLNATQAAIRAGYSAKTATQQAARLLTNVKVESAIALQQSIVSKRIQRTVQDVMDDIGRVRDNAMQLVQDPETGTNAMLSHKDALKALELECKRLGAFTERVDLTNSDGTLRPNLIKIVAAEVKK